jgi:hypothetical protein
MTGFWTLAIWLGLGVWLVQRARHRGDIKEGDLWYQERCILTMLVGPPCIVAGVCLACASAVASALLVVLAIGLAMLAGVLAPLSGAILVLALAGRLLALVVKHAVERVVGWRALRALRQELLGVSLRGYGRIRAKQGDRFTICAGCRGALLTHAPMREFITCSLPCALETLDRVSLFGAAVKSGLPLRAARRVVRGPSGLSRWEMAYRTACRQAAGWESENEGRGSHERV